MSVYPLDPSLQRYVDACSAFRPASSAIEDIRRSFQQSSLYFTPSVPEGYEVIDDEACGVKVRIFRPTQAEPSGGWPTVMYLHGGGWMLGSHCTHDWFAYALCRRLPIAIVTVNYRLAPECTFPAPLDDAFTVWQALCSQRWAGLSNERLAVAGDSAGGTISAGLCMKLRDLKLRQPRAQALIYPVTTRDTDLASMRKHVGAPLFGAKDLHASFDAYIPGWRTGATPGALPMDHSDYGKLAPAFIGIAEFDPVADHGAAYAEMLTLAGVPVVLYVAKGMIHDCLRATGVNGVELLYDAMTEQLAIHLAYSG